MQRKFLKSDTTRGRGRPAVNRRDTRGTVQITVARMNGSNMPKGNIVRSVRVADAKVTIVMRAIERALLE